MNKLWSILFAAIMLAAAVSFMVAPAMGWWLPKDVSTFGYKVDGLFYLILYITGFFFILTEALLVYFMWAYASEPGRPEPVFGHHYAEKKVFWTSFFKSIFRPVTAILHNQHRVELAWTLVPAVILLFIALVQIQAWAEIKYPGNMPSFDKGALHPDPLQIEVAGRQFEWRIRYPSKTRMEAWLKKPGEEGYEDPKGFAANRHIDDVHVINAVHTWVDKPVLIQLKTQDVLHSFYIPALRLKQDAVPGKTIPVWFQATQSNTRRNGDRWEDGWNPVTQQAGDRTQLWELLCAELCGWGHYKMQGRLYVHATEAEYREWLDYASKEQNRSTPPKPPVSEESA